MVSNGVQRVQWMGSVTASLQELIEGITQPTVILHALLKISLEQPQKISS